MVGVKGDTIAMQLLEVVDLFPGREARGEGPAFDCEANVAKERNVRVIWTPEGAWEGCWVFRWSGWGSRDFSDNGSRRKVVARENDE